MLNRAARLAPPETEEEGPSWITVNTGGSSTWPRSELYDDRGRRDRIRRYQRPAVCDGALPRALQRSPDFST